MRVKFVINSSKEFLYSRGIHLNYNNTYVVYGLDIKDNSNIHFMLVDDSGSIIPNFYPDVYFEVVDRRLSKYWEGKLSDYYYHSIYANGEPSLITFGDALENKFFFDDLFNGVEETIGVMKKYIFLFDHEFPNFNLKDASIIDNDWIMCNYCDEIWKEESGMGIVNCPNCFKDNNNPLWLGIPLIKENI